MVWTNLVNPINIFIAPTKVFEDLKNRPNWFIPFILITLLTIGVGYFLLPFKQEIMFSTLSAQIGEVRAQETLSNANRFAFVGLLFAPVPLLIKWLLVAALLYYAAILFDAHNVTFKKIFSIVVHTEFILLLIGIINILILEIKGITSVNNLSDLQTIVGLEYFLKNKTNDIYLFTILSNFNIFTIWYVIVLAIGLSIVSQLEKWKSSIIVSFVWLFGVGFQIAIAFLSANIQKMMGK